MPAPPSTPGIAAAILATTAPACRAVPAAPTSVRDRSMPCSRKVGMSGWLRMRSVAITPSPRICPDISCGAAEATVTNTVFRFPAARSWMAGPPPR